MYVLTPLKIVRVNFVHEWRDLQFIVDFERPIFEQLFIAILFNLRAFARNYQKVGEGIFFLASGLSRGFMSSKPTPCLLEYSTYELYVLHNQYTRQPKQLLHILIGKKNIPFKKISGGALLF